MVVPYNLTIIGKGFVPLMKTANTIVGGWLGVGFILLIITISFVVTKRYPSKKAALGSFYFGLLMSVLFRLMEILSTVMMFSCFFLFVLVLIWNYVED